MSKASKAPSQNTIRTSVNSVFKDFNFDCNFEFASRLFLAGFSFEGFDRILDGSVTNPNDGSAEEKDFLFKNSLIYTTIMFAIARTKDNSTFTSLMLVVDPDDGKAAWDAIKKHFTNESVLTRNNLICDMISLKRKEGEAVSRFRERAGLNFSRVDALNIRLSDLQACIFINGLGPEFKDLINNLNLQPSLTLQKATNDALQFEAQIVRGANELITPEEGLKHARRATTLNEDHDEKLAHAYYVYRTRHPDNMRQPKALYRRLKCFSCGSFGHKAADCYYKDRKRKNQNEKEEKEKEEESPKKAMMARSNVFDKSPNGGEIRIANSR